jgi:hypothetical protein
MRTTLLAAGLAVLAAPARAAGSADLSGQFPDPACRQQGAVGSCHAFSSVALLEAALFRGGGKRIRLSEADLFIQCMVAGGRLWEHFSIGTEDGLQEGASPLGDLEVALSTGVATSLSYDAFFERYEPYRKKIQAAVDDVVGAERWLNPALAGPIDLRGPVAAFLDDPAQVRVAVKKLLLGREEAIAAERGKVRDLLSGYSLSAAYFPGMPWPQVTRAASCREHGAGQKEAVLRLLWAGRPAGVAMKLTGLKAWKMPWSWWDDAMHAFLITGYRTEPSGEVRFLTRNSWGGQNPEIREDELCRILLVYSVDTPGEGNRLEEIPGAVRAAARKKGRGAP